MKYRSIYWLIRWCVPYVVLATSRVVQVPASPPFSSRGLVPKFAVLVAQMSGCFFRTGGIMLPSHWNVIHAAHSRYQTRNTRMIFKHKHRSTCSCKYEQLDTLIVHHILSGILLLTWWIVKVRIAAFVCLVLCNIQIVKGRYHIKSTEKGHANWMLFDFTLLLVLAIEFQEQIVKEIVKVSQHVTTAHFVLIVWWNRWSTHAVGVVLESADQAVCLTWHSASSSQLARFQDRIPTVRPETTQQCGASALVRHFFWLLLHRTARGKLENSTVPPASGFRLQSVPTGQTSTS